MSLQRKFVSQLSEFMIYYNKRARTLFLSRGEDDLETYEFSHSFAMGSLLISPVHVRIEVLPPVIAAHQHANTSYEIHYTAQGHGTVTINGQTYPVAADTLYITGPDVEHIQTSQRDDPIREYCLYLDCQRVWRGDNDPLALFADTPFWMGQDEGGVFPLMEQLIRENRCPQPDTAEMSETLLRQIIIVLTRLYRRRVSARTVPISAPALTRAGLMPVIEDAFFYRYRELTLDSLAALLNLSNRQTQRVLKQHFGKTFSQKLAEARLAAACQFLLTTQNSITDISARLGFSSIEHFSASFRQAMGCSPRKYRQKGQK